MKISKYLKSEQISLDVLLTDKDSILHFIAHLFGENKIVDNVEDLYEGLQSREQTMSTGIGNGIAFPHSVSEHVDDVSVLLITLANPVDFYSLDHLPVDIIMAIVIPENQTALHLQILAGVSRLCNHPMFRKIVENAKTPEKLYRDIKSLEEEIAFH